MKAKGILIIAVACFVLAGVATDAWGLCRAWVRLEADSTSQLPKTTGEYEPCEEWLVWEFDFFFQDDPGQTIIKTETYPTNFCEIYYSDDQNTGWNHFEGYVWDDDDTHETVIDIAIGSSHFYYMDLYVQYSASQPDR
jgi:hypothetical protein